MVFRLTVPGQARLELYDVLSRLVGVLAEGEHAGGAHTAALDTSTLASGVYVLRLIADGRSDARRITVAR